MHSSPDPSPDRGALLAFARAADAGLAAAGGDGAILRVTGLPPAAESFARFSLGGAHPLELLLGFVAPPHWVALGVSCRGVAHPLDASGRPCRRTAGRVDGTEPVAVTVLLDRAGAAAGVMRRGDVVREMPGQPEGTVADACRRALGLPTPPPPESTRELWTMLWLDRVVEAAGRADAASPLASWSVVAGLHAAAGRLGELPATAPDPVSLAAAAEVLAEAWPWRRLRAAPGAIDLPGPVPSPRLAAWMDDGMWARWLLSHLPARDDLLSAVHALLPASLAQAVARVARPACE